MGNYQKRVKGQDISADEIGSHNFVQIFGDGSGKIVVCFCLVLVTAMIVYLWLMMHVILVIVMVGCVVVFSAIGASATWRHISNTRKTHLVNENEIKWSGIIYRTENLIATLDRSTGQVSIHNAQEVSIQHHHAAPQLQISENASGFDDDIMPPLNTRNGA